MSVAAQRVINEDFMTQLYGQHGNGYVIHQFSVRGDAIITPGELEAAKQGIIAQAPRSVPCGSGMIVDHGYDFFSHPLRL